MSDEKLCACGKPIHGRKDICVNCYNKEYYRTHPEFRKRMAEQHREYHKRPEVKKRNNEYEKRPEVRKRTNEYNKKRYHSDETYRQKTLERSKKYQKKHCCLGLGDPKLIKEMCKDFGFSDKVCDAIALDGKVLDDLIKKKVGD